MKLEIMIIDRLPMLLILPLFISSPFSFSLAFSFSFNERQLGCSARSGRYCWAAGAPSRGGLNGELGSAHYWHCLFARQQWRPL